MYFQCEYIFIQHILCQNGNFDNQGNRETHMRVAVIGSRAPSTESKKRVVAYLDRIKKDINMIVTGGAFGMDSVGMIYAVNNKIPLTVFEPIGYHNTELCGIYRKLPNCNIVNEGKGFLERNTDIINNCDVVVSGDFGNGTIDAMTKAVKKGIPVYVFGEYIPGNYVKRIPSGITFIKE